MLFPGLGQISSATQSKSIKRLRTALTNVNKRVFIHTGLLVVIGLVATRCGLSAEHARAALGTAPSQTAITADQSSTLTAAAILAKSTNALIQNDVAKKASDASAQVVLASAGDDFLASHQPPATAGSPTRDIINYTVLGGDTLSGIAQKFNITSNTILWANNLADDATIKPGQTLIILPVSGVLYTTAAGDTPAAIAAKYQANASLIESYNNLSGDPIAAGTKLIVPDGVVPAAPKPAATQPAILTNTFTSAPRVVNFRGGANGYAFGYCTWYVASRRAVPNNWGNASSWYYNAQADGWAVGSAPAAGAIAWQPGGNHVAYVESVSGGMVTVSEMNYWGGGGGWDRVSYRTVPASTFRYIY